MNRSVLRVGILSALCLSAYASDITVVTTAYSSLGRGWAPPPVTVPLPPPDPTPVTPAPPSTPTQTVTPTPTPTPVQIPSTPNGTATIPGTLNGNLSGGGITYNLSSSGDASMSGNPVALSLGIPFTFSNYSGSLAQGSKLTGATLNINMLIGAAVGTVTNSDPSSPFFVPTLAGLLSNPVITISAGSISHTINGTSASAYDLLANGFGPQLTAGAPLVITFNATDTVSAVGSYTPPTTTNVNILGFSGRGVYTPPPPVMLGEMLTLTESRTVNGTFTLTLTSDQGGVQEAPEPFSMVLTGCGLAAIGYLRFRKRHRSSPASGSK
jgi:hypothetical protein